MESAESSPPACRLPFTCKLPKVRSVGSAVEVSNSKAAPTLSVAGEACNWVAPTRTAPELACTLKEEDEAPLSTIAASLKSATLSILSFRPVGATVFTETWARSQQHMLDLAVIALAVTDATRIAQLCSPVLPPPSTGGLARRPCRVSKLSVGNSNSLYRLDVGDDSYLAREFGTNAALDLNRARENEIFARLAAAGIAPGLLGTFEGGRVEEWVDGGPCSADECRSAEVAEAVARRLAALHAFDEGGAAEPWAISTATEWLDGAQRCAKALEDPRC